MLSGFIQSVNYIRTILGSKHRLGFGLFINPKVYDPILKTLTVH